MLLYIIFVMHMEYYWLLNYNEGMYKMGNKLSKRNYGCHGLSHCISRNGQYTYINRRTIEIPLNNQILKAKCTHKFSIANLGISDSRFL